MATKLFKIGWIVLCILPNSCISIFIKIGRQYLNFEAALSLLLHPNLSNLFVLCVLPSKPLYTNFPKNRIISKFQTVRSLPFLTIATKLFAIGCIVLCFNPNPYILIFIKIWQHLSLDKSKASNFIFTATKLYEIGCIELRILPSPFIQNRTIA